MRKRKAMMMRQAQLGSARKGGNLLLNFPLAAGDQNVNEENALKGKASKNYDLQNRLKLPIDKVGQKDAQSAKFSKLTQVYGENKSYRHTVGGRPHGTPGLNSDSKLPNKSARANIKQLLRQDSKIVYATAQRPSARGL